MREDTYRLPDDWKIQRVPTALSETVDWSHEFLGIPAAWRVTRGRGIKMLVLDTGCANHPDLDIEDGMDFTRSIHGASDSHGHGTWCCGAVGARANGIGVIGIMPECTLYSGKVLGDNGSGTEDTIGAGVEWGLQLDVDIISMSLGGPPMSNPLRRQFQEFVGRRGHFIFAAAGNDGRANSVNCPGIWEETICCGAVDKQGKRTKFSSMGPRVDVVGPGFEMLSTIPGGYGLNSGTSMTTPQIASIAGLGLAKHREKGGKTGLETVADMREHLKRTSIDKGLPGRDDEYGFGLIDPAKLLEGIDPDQPVPVLPAPPSDGWNQLGPWKTRAVELVLYYKVS